MEQIFDLATKLGESLKDAPQVAAMTAAKEAYEAHPEVAQEVEDYTKKHQEYQMKMQQGALDDEAQKEFADDMAKRAESIRNNEIAAALFAAEGNFNQYMQSIFNVVTSVMMGEDPMAAAGGCAPSDCAGCGGSCGCGQ
ncbi:MAG: YlbF family regulator [Bacillota bacterium]